MGATALFFPDQLLQVQKSKRADTAHTPRFSPIHMEELEKMRAGEDLPNLSRKHLITATKCLQLHWWLDEGKKNRELEQLQLHLESNIVCIEEDIQSYLNPECLREVSIVNTRRYNTNVFAVFYLYQASCGAVGSIRIIPYQDNISYITDSDNTGYILEKFLIQSIRTLNNFTVRSVPLFIPENLGYSQIHISVVRYFAKYLPERKIFSQWNPSDCAKLLKLGQEGWWNL